METTQERFTPATMADNLVRLVMTADCDFPPDFIAALHRLIHSVYLSEED